MPPPQQAQQLNAQGIALKEEGRLDEAADAYRQAVALAPDWDAPHYNLGLVYKLQKDWPRSLEHNRRAAALAPANQPAWWNMGIAATALGQWDQAGAAWRGFGINVPDGEGPVEFPCGVGPVRLNPDGGGEVVWGHRLDPARMVLLSVPLPESGFCWSDVVLNDGEPVGTRRYGGRDLPVFNALALLQRSPFGTFVARVRMPPDKELMGRLTEIAVGRGGAVEDWSTSIRMICRACSEGRPHEGHDEELRGGPRAIAVAARDRAHATEILRAWEAEQGGARVESLDDGLVRTPDSGGPG